MKRVRLAVTIKKPRLEVFDFVLDPENTPKWVDFIVAEESSERPARLGTMYRNQNRAGEWTEYKITSFDPGKMFVLSPVGGEFQVRYTLKTISYNETELEFVVWADRGQLRPFPIDNLLKLKQILESRA